jgi:Neprosin
LIDNNGAGGKFATFQSKTESKDFSLLQLSVSRLLGATGIPGTGTNKLQTLEAGVIVYPGKFGDSKVHLFTYYTTNGYIKDGNNLGGWNTEVKGWVQVDSVTSPGRIYKPSVVGGQQYEVTIQYELYNGNWWLWVTDRWIGYYPATLFSAKSPTKAKTLGHHSDRVDFFGEVYDSDGIAGVTTTDMGSGKFASAGKGQSAYIRNIFYESLTGPTFWYSGVTKTVSDAKRYTLDTHFNSGGSWGSYMWLGGPGKV